MQRSVTTTTRYVPTLLHLHSIGIGCVHYYGGVATDIATRPASDLVHIER